MCRFLFFTQKTAYEMRISDWSSDVCSSDLGRSRAALQCQPRRGHPPRDRPVRGRSRRRGGLQDAGARGGGGQCGKGAAMCQRPSPLMGEGYERSEEHTSELQSLMRISYAAFCLKKKIRHIIT